MGKILNTLFNFILGLCPFANVLTILCQGIITKKYKLIITSATFLLLELFIFINILRTEVFDNYFRINILVLITVLTFAWMYSSSVFFHQKNNYAFKRIVSFLIASILSCFFILINIVNIYLFLKQKRYIWVLPQVVIFILTSALFTQILPNQFLGLVFLLNFTTIILWLFIDKKAWIESNLTNSLFKKQSFSVNTENQQHEKTQESSGNNTRKNKKPLNSTYHRGWTTDDTLHLSINLLTIEDIIYPITLKNEHEKSTKDLIQYIRKLSRYNDSEIDNLIGRDGLSAYLKTHLQKIDLESVRSVYIKSLWLLIEDYSNRDTRVTIYLEKLNPVKAN